MVKFSWILTNIMFVNVVTIWLYRAIASIKGNYTSVHYVYAEKGHKCSQSTSFSIKMLICGIPISFYLIPHRVELYLTTFKKNLLYKVKINQKCLKM